MAHHGPLPEELLPEVREAIRRLAESAMVATFKVTDVQPYAGEEKPMRVVMDGQTLEITCYEAGSSGEPPGRLQRVVSIEIPDILPADLEKTLRNILDGGSADAGTSQPDAEADFPVAPTLPSYLQYAGPPVRLDVWVAQAYFYLVRLVIRHARSMADIPFIEHAISDLKDNVFTGDGARANQAVQILQSQRLLVSQHRGRHMVRLRVVEPKATKPGRTVQNRASQSAPAHGTVLPAPPDSLHMEHAPGPGVQPVATAAMVATPKEVRMKTIPLGVLAAASSVQKLIAGLLKKRLSTLMPSIVIKDDGRIVLEVVVSGAEKHMAALREAGCQLVVDGENEIGVAFTDDTPAGT